MPDLDIREFLILRGPNIWANYPVIEAWVDLGSLKDTSSDTVAGFNDRLKAWLPGMIEHRCSVGERGGFFQRLDRGTYPAHILEHVAIELQNLAGHRVGYGKARHTCVDGLYKVVVRYLDEVVGQACLRTGRELLMAAYRDEPFDVEAEVEKLRDLVDENALGPSTRAVVNAARDRGIPWRRLQEGRSLIQLGYGVKQRRIWTAETDRTGAIAGFIAQDKELTRSLLRKAGVPLPEGRTVSGADDAWDAAQDLGLPVVVKPRDANHGRGVFLDLTTEAHVRAAWPEAASHGDGVIVERFIPGVEHRLLVIGGELVAALRDEPAAVTGDGRLTIRELVESQLNSDPSRGQHYTAAWSKIDTANWDPTVVADLEHQGFQVDSVPCDGERVVVYRFANPAADVTDAVHPSVRDHVTTAVKVIGLDIAGVDLVCADISQPLEGQGGCIVEVNSSPRLNGYLQPAAGTPRPVGEAVVRMLFPDNENGRIPVVGVTGTRGKTLAVRLLTHLLKSLGKRLGVASSDGLQFGPRFVKTAGADRISGAHGVLLHPWTEMAVCEISTESILRDGIGFDRCDIGIVINVGRDQLGLCYIDTIEQMAKVKRCIVDIVLPAGTAVLNADDLLVAEMAEHCDGAVVLFSASDTSEIVRVHREKGGRAVFVRDGQVILATGDAELPLCALTEIAIPVHGHFAFHLESVLSATAAAWVAGVGLSAIIVGLATFNPPQNEASAA